MVARYDEDGRKIDEPAHAFGQDLDKLSVEEIAERIGLLKQEILRLEETKNGKSGSVEAAEAFFKK